MSVRFLFWFPLNTSKDRSVPVAKRFAKYITLVVQPRKKSFHIVKTMPKQALHQVLQCVESVEATICFLLDLNTLIRVHLDQIVFQKVQKGSKYHVHLSSRPNVPFVKLKGQKTNILSIITIYYKCICSVMYQHSRYKSCDGRPYPFV